LIIGRAGSGGSILQAIFLPSLLETMQYDAPVGKPQDNNLHVFLGPMMLNGKFLFFLNSFLFTSYKTITVYITFDPEAVD